MDDDNIKTFYKNFNLYMNHLKSYFGFLFLFSFVSFSCKPKAAEAEDAPTEAITPVTLTTISDGPMADYIQLNATSTFLLKSYVKANAIGYLQSAVLQVGKLVKKGDLLFTLKTKESQSIGNTIDVLDSTFKFSGLTQIRANITGYITQLDHQSGDYVQDGEQLAIISESSSFVFLMNVPYEMKPFLVGKKQVNLYLPDGTTMSGNITSTMPTVDSVSQTQAVVIKIESRKMIPENLVAKVRLEKTSKNAAISLPKEAILSNETQTSFWVMKMMDSTTAVKVPIKKGIETTDRIEVLSPIFSGNDKIVLTGNYGLGDTAKVSVAAIKE